MKVHPYKKINECPKCGHRNQKWTFNKRFCTGVSERTVDEEGDDVWHTCNAGLDLGSEHLHLRCQHCRYEFLMHVKPSSRFEG